MIKIAINGFGRIGRVTFRHLFSNPEVEVVAINDLVPPKNLAYLLKYDTSHRGFFVDEITTTDSDIIVKGQSIKVFAEKDPTQLPWKELDIDLVIESTGFFRTRAKAQLHLDAGAKKVIISAPASNDMPTIVYGVNHEMLTSEDKIISGASCTTNCLVPVVYVLDKEFGLKKGLMTTIHAATNDQKILDLPHVDYRRGRAVFDNIIPTSTGAAIAVGRVLPKLNGLLDGIALRIPSPIGSIVDLSVELNQNVTSEQINSAFKKYACDKLKGVLKYNCDPIVSSDVIGSSYGSIFDATLTKVLTDKNDHQMVKLFSWYDNESSYVSQMVRTALYFAKI